MGVLVVAYGAMVLLTAWSPGRVLPPPADAQVESGLAEWRGHRCGTCHALFGLGGHLGPDLTDIGTRRPAGYVAGRIASGGAGMPSFPDADAAAIEAYLRWIDETGDHPPATWPVWGYGR